MNSSVNALADTFAEWNVFYAIRFFPDNSSCTSLSSESEHVGPRAGHYFERGLLMKARDTLVKTLAPTCSVKCLHCLASTTSHHMRSMHCLQ